MKKIFYWIGHGMHVLALWLDDLEAAFQRGLDGKQIIEDEEVK